MLEVAAVIVNVHLQEALLAAALPDGVQPLSRRFRTLCLTFQTVHDIDIIDCFYVDRGTVQQIVDMCRPHL